jgi:hypothetical protein
MTRQPIARSGQLGRELGGSPGRVMPEPPAPSVNLAAVDFSVDISIAAA